MIEIVEVVVVSAGASLLTNWAMDRWRRAHKKPPLSDAFQDAVDRVCASNIKTRQEHLDSTPQADWKNVTPQDIKPDAFDLRCFHCGFAKYYQDKRGARYAGEDGTTETCRRCNKPVRWESGAEEQARTVVPTKTIATAAIPTKTTAPQEPCKKCGGRMVFGDLNFCPDCTKHIRPLPFSLDLQGACLTKANIVDFARIVGWHRIACWTGSRDALLGMPDNESNWASCDEASAWHRDRVRKERGQKDVFFGRPIKTTDYHPTDRLLAYDLAGDWTGQIINIGKYPQKADGE